MHRLSVTCGRSVKTDGMPVPLYLFPTAESVHRATDERLRSVGLSANKAATLRRVAEALASGTLDATVLEQSASPGAVAVLRGIKGIGPWTAAIILLRGLGRLDVFPANDTSVASNIALVARSAPFDVQGVLNALGTQRGMLYSHLLTPPLEARGETGRESFGQANLDDRIDPTPATHTGELSGTRIGTSCVPHAAWPAVPAKAVLLPWSQRVPWIAMIGVFRASLLQEVSPGAPVFSRYFTMSPFHMS